MRILAIRPRILNGLVRPGISLGREDWRPRLPSWRRVLVGAIHTQTIEGFWSIFKRGIVGTFHKMSRKYMPLYVAEFQFRYNNRENTDIFGTPIKGC